MVRLGREMQSHRDYTLGKDCRIFRNMYVQEPRKNPDNYLIPRCLHITTLREHAKYFRWHTWLPLRTLTIPMREDEIFTALRRAIPKPKAREERKNAWILEDTWRLIDMRIYTCQYPVHGQGLL